MKPINLMRRATGAIAFLVASLLILISNTAVAQQLPLYPADQVPEAFSGFQMPLDYELKRGCGDDGFCFLENTGRFYGSSCLGTDPQTVIYHPGWDMNKLGTSGNGDIGEPVRAVADGMVVWMNHGGWMGVVIQHKYRGEMFFSGYGHVQKVTVQLGQRVYKGQQIAEVGKEDARYAHLHFEIRTMQHPHPAYGNYFCLIDRWAASELGDHQAVTRYYRNPESFIHEHPAYTSGASEDAEVLADLKRATDPIWYLSGRSTEVVHDTGWDAPPWKIKSVYYTGFGAGTDFEVFHAKHPDGTKLWSWYHPWFGFHGWWHIEMVTV